MKTAIETAIENQVKSKIYTARYRPCRFTRMTPLRGVGKILTVISVQPGLTHKEILSFLPGTAAQAETFTRLRAAKVIENHKGFYLTDLGKKVMKEAGLL